MAGSLLGQKSSKPTGIVLIVFVATAVWVAVDFRNGWNKGMEDARAERETQSRAASTSLPTTATTANTEADSRDDPADVIRGYMIAAARRDQQGVLDRVVPNPDAHLVWEVTDAPDAAHIDELIELFRTLPIEALKIGDELADPFTPGQKVTAEMIDDDHRILIMRTKGKAAWTHFVQREKGGRWRVNVDWFITGLKHAPTRNPTTQQEPAGPSVR